MNILKFFSPIRYLTIGLLAFLVCVLPALGQSTDKKEINQAEIAFNNGNYLEAIRFAKIGIESNRSNKLAKLDDLEITINSNIALYNFADAEKSLTEALGVISKLEQEPEIKARIYFCGAALFRFQRKSSLAFEFLNKALFEDPANSDTKARYYLDIGRILYSSGYDISAIVWLEKAERIYDSKVTTIPKMDTYRFLSLAWAAKADFQTAIRYAKKLVKITDRTKYKYKHREALFTLGTILSATGQKTKALSVLNQGQKYSIAEKHNFQAQNFTNTLMLNHLYNKNVTKASNYLDQLEILDTKKSFSSEILLGKAVLSALKGQIQRSNELFEKLEENKSISKFLLYGWKITIADHNKEWNKVLMLNKKLLELSLEHNFRDDLAQIYFTFAKTYFYLGETQKPLKNLRKSLSFIEDQRSTNNKSLSLGILETYHNAYRLLAQINSKNIEESFETVDFLKARFLYDRINNQASSNKIIIPTTTRKKLEELTTRYIEDQNNFSEIEEIEKTITNAIPDVEIEKKDLGKLNEIQDLKGTAVVSYFFTVDKKLLAYVWEKSQPLKIIDLQVSESEMIDEAKNVHKKIKNFIFFKRDGKRLYDKLLKPLEIKAKHLIIIPDKSLWKIPFQAFSPDGKKYLIEEKLISYSPSISILLDQIQNATPKRNTLQAFANSSYDKRFLKYVNSEAKAVSDLYNSNPVLNAGIQDFQKLAERSDINHFSMHAEVDNEQPLDSFLAFRETRTTEGRLRVGEILDMNIKQGSLAFLASCDTTNILNGEGLVSLSWALMGAGASTVISAQWEANDRSTQEFTKNFYKSYKKGSSSAEALQKASLELIRNKSDNMHEPYYWGHFTLVGDFR